MEVLKMYALVFCDKRLANKYTYKERDKGILEHWKIQLTRKLKTETVIRNILSQSKSNVFPSHL